MITASTPAEKDTDPPAAEKQATLDRMGWRWLALGVVGVHYLYLAYCITGGFLALRRPWTVVLHVAAVGWAFVQVKWPQVCPLTVLMDDLRVRGGQRPLHRFLDFYVRDVIYPVRYERTVELVLAGVVVVSWVLLAVHVTRRHRDRRDRRAAAVPGSLAAGGRTP